MIVEAKDFAGQKVAKSFHFGGAAREQIVAALSKLINAVADERVVITRVEVSTKIAGDDYMQTTLSLTYAERDEPSSAEGPSTTDEPPSALYAVHQPNFPVEIRRR